MLKADDLLAMDSSEPQESSTTTTSVFLRPAEIRRPTAIASASKYVFEFSYLNYWKILFFLENVRLQFLLIKSSEDL
jgi:hypothetical protein